MFMTAHAVNVYFMYLMPILHIFMSKYVAVPTFWILAASIITTQNLPCIIIL